MSINIYVYEGSWDKPSEAPQVLPYLQAYEQTFRDVRVHHRSIRNADDLGYYVSKIPKNDQAFVYVACHGNYDYLQPSSRAERIGMVALKDCLSKAKPNAIGFLHFGCCHFLTAQYESRRDRLTQLLSAASGSVFVSGYTTAVDWLPSTLLDLAFLAEVYVPWRKEPTKRALSQRQAQKFITSDYLVPVRTLGFSSISGLIRENPLLPERLSTQ